MDTEDALQRLQSLQRDLVAFTESRLANLARLESELDASMEDFRRLLEKKKRSNASRNALDVNPSGNPPMMKVRIDEQEYSITNDFREGAYTVADELDLDEIEAAKLCLAVNEDCEGAPGILPLKAILHFQRQREVLLDCARILCRKAADSDAEDEAVDGAKNAVDEMVRGKERKPAERPLYWRRCIEGLSDIEASIKKTQDHIQTLAMTGQSLLTPTGEALQASRMLLTHQHESLASMMAYLIRIGYVEPEDFRAFMSKAASTETPLDVMAHYVPVLLDAARHFGSGDAPEQAAHDLHRLFAKGPGQLQWKMKQFQYATTLWWLAEYSARFGDVASGVSSRSGLAKLEEERSELFKECCKGKAFHLMLAIADFLKPEVWYDPAKAGLVGFLLDASADFPHDATVPSRDFAALTMDGLQGFVEAFVSNMPDLLRRLKTQEDDERRNFLSSTLPPEQGHPDTMDLERFILVVARAYQENDEAAKDFWSDREGNLYGFLRWASQRLPTPRVAAFCELLRSLSNDEKSANNAHRFLLEDTVTLSGKMRKAYAVSWAQIFTELELYASTNRSKPALSQPLTAHESSMAEPNIEEKETPIMLEAYLRLATHICLHSSEARNWILREQPFRLHDHLFALVQSSSPSNVQACCFDLLAALLTDKTSEVSDGLWSALDSWIAGGGSAGSGIPRYQANSGLKPPTEKHYLQRIAANAEVATAFVNLLNALVVPAHHQSEPTLDALPFPESLGSTHRHVGIEPYVDFVLGQALTKPLNESGVYDNRVLSNVLRHACLTFMWLCLTTFNEDLVVLANTSNVSVESSMKTSSLATYVRLHPFARTMEHLFNNNTIAALFDSLHQNPDELETLDVLSPVVQTSIKAVQVMDLAMKLQPTYFDVVRPIIKTQTQARAMTVANAAIASFDEVMLSQLDIVVYLEHYAVCRHPELALEALSLLTKLSTSRKLTGTVDTLSGHNVGNRLVSHVQVGADAIATELRHNFEVSYLDLEIGEQPERIGITKALLELLNSSLDASPNKVTIAHSLLGLVERSGRVRTADVTDDSLFAAGRSLFHTIASAAVELQTTFDGSNVSWLLAIKRGCLEVLAKLSASALTSSLILGELRRMDFLLAMSMCLLETKADLPWDGMASLDNQTLLSPAGAGVCDFMRMREAYCEYTALELRAVAEARLDSVREKEIRAVLGIIEEGGEQLPATSMLMLIDFLDIDSAAPAEAALHVLTDVDLSPCVIEDAQALVRFDLKSAEELLLLRKRELWKAGRIVDTVEETQANDEIQATLASLRMQNTNGEIQRARLDAVEAWTDAMSAIITVGGIPDADRSIVALQSLQHIMPKFERSLGDNIDAAGLFARLTLTLVQAASVTAEPVESQVAAQRNDRLQATFRVCLKAITDGDSNAALRDVCYRTCCLILTSLASPSTPSTSTPKDRSLTTSTTRSLIQQIQTSSSHTTQILTNDAFSGRGSTRVSALLFLDSLLSLFHSAHQSSWLLRALTKLNFVPVLLDGSIGSISSAFGPRSAEKDLTTTLSYFHTALALILNLCKTPEGTQLVLNSGLFASIADSQLFSTDPDIGLDIDNQTALRQFYRLLSSVLRVITAVVAARGPSNAATVQQAKNFLAQNRGSMQAVFKRTSRVQKTAGPPEEEAVVVADEFVRLMLVTGFLEVSCSSAWGRFVLIFEQDDEPAHAKTARRNAFT